MTQRLLLFFSYIGTNYKGVQRSLGRNSKAPDLESIQGIIEFGINKVLRREDSAIVLSSRTDTGVHAIQSSAHFDNKGATSVNPARLCQSLNQYLEKNGTDIRVKSVVEVPREFHCRSNAKSRSYCYRIALFKNNEFGNCLNLNYLSGALPITEIYRCEPVLQPVNFQQVYETAKLFLGKWNFKTFSASSREETDKEENNFIKTILSISVGKVSTEEIFPNNLEREIYQKFDFYEFHIEGSGFLRRQVRKMVGALLGIGKGEITEKELKFMLENPSRQHWNNKCSMVSSYGLYLKSVNYQDIPILRC